jgi:hypothetical protein
MFRIIGTCTEYTECQAFFPVARTGSPPHPLTCNGVFVVPPPPPPHGPKGGDTLACGGGRGVTQFRRRDRHSGYTTVPARESERSLHINNSAPVCLRVLRFFSLCPCVSQAATHENSPSYDENFSSESI